MAHTPNGRYVVIEADIWLDKKTDTVKITTSDPDVPAEGIYLTAKKGSKTEKNLRDLLNKFCAGKTKEDWAAIALRQARTRADAHLEKGDVEKAIACLKKAADNAQAWLDGTHEKQDQAYVPEQLVTTG